LPYLYETHYHTPYSSYCCLADPRDALPLYAAGAYSGVIVTDHYYDFGGSDPRYDPDRWLEGYRKAQKAGEGIGINVILGMELRFTENYKDYLVFGMDEDLICQNPRMFEMTPREFRVFADANALFFSQAHPFRGEPALPELLHGAEVYNGNPRQHCNNHLAEAFARENNLVMLSGSDFHQMEDACLGGIYLPENPKDSRELAELLLNRRTEGFIK